MRSSRRSSLALAAATLLTLGVVACAPQPSTELEAQSTSETVPSAPVPTAFPSTEPTLVPPDDVLDEGDEPPTYERTWTSGAWPSVAVPASPVPRLPITCAQLLESSGLTGVLRPLTVQPTIDALGVRQGGATVCSFAQTLPSGAAVATLHVAVDYAVGRDSDAQCSYSDPVSVPTACRGTVDVGAGSAMVYVGLPAQADPDDARVVAQSLLDAGEAALLNPGTIRSAPAINNSAMGAGAGECSPSASQTEALFSQVDSYTENRDVYGSSSIGNELLAQEMHRRVATTSCWWWLGWMGMSITVVPGAGWAILEPGVVGTPVTVEGADAALRLERNVQSGVTYGGEPPAELIEITITTSARGSAVVTTAQVEPSLLQYWRERLVAATEAIIATQP